MTERKRNRKIARERNKTEKKREKQETDRKRKKERQKNRNREGERVTDRQKKEPLLPLHDAGSASGRPVEDPWAVFPAKAH